MKPTAVVGRRVGAYLLDYLVYYVLIGVVFFALAQKDTELLQDISSGDLDPDATLYGNFTIGDTQYSVTGGRAAIFFVIAIVLGILNFVVLPGVKGWSIGKLMTGIRVVRDDGSGTPGILRAFARQVLWIVDGFPYFIPNLVGFVLALTTANNKRLGDMVASTVVVKKEYAEGTAPSRAPESAFPEPVAEAEAAPAPVMGTASMPAVAPGGWSPQPEPAPVAASPSSPPADWYPDPHGQKRLRYWDGNAWTEHTAD